ncbi:MAG: zinc ribbon domain-containing protein [Tepidiformaceae bacterium]
MSQVTEIVALQSIDDEAAAFRAALDDVERRLQGNDELNAARREFAAADADLQEAQKDQRRIDGQIEGLTAKIVPEEKRLYDGSVKNAKELANIQHEVDNLKQQRATFEEGLLEVLEHRERADTDRVRTLAEVTRLEGLWEKEQQELKHETKVLGDSIAKAERTRELQKERVNARALHTYEEVRRRRAGVAVAKVTRGNCGVCRIGIPDVIRKRAFSSETLTQCPNCDRILYIG